MKRADPLQRERECFELLRAVQQEEVILIGGYALSAFGRPRFSTDLDLVMSDSTAIRVRRILQEAGCRQVKEWGGDSAWSAERWEKGPEGHAVAVDLLVGGVTDRNSGAAFSYPELRPMAAVRDLRGVDPLRSARILVADREALIALKLSAGREVDLRDVAALSRGPVDVDRVAELLRRVPATLVRDRLRTLLDSLETRRFRDSLQGEYRMDRRAGTPYFDSTRDLCKELEARL